MRYKNEHKYIIYIFIIELYIGEVVPMAKKNLSKEEQKIVDGLRESKGLSLEQTKQRLDNKLGKPYYIINKKIKNFLKKKMSLNNFNLFLSISDEKEYSIAFTIIQKKND